MNIYDLWFCSAKLSNKIKLSLIKKLGDTKEIWNYSNSCNKNLFLYNEDIKIKSRLKSAANITELEKLLTKSLESYIETVNFNDDRYPKKLKYYEDSPSLLFYKGNIDKLNKGVSAAIIGSRKCSLYGRNVASLISKELSANNINIISGMAKGIDSYAHRLCIENMGYTCAVLGAGIDVIYPKENKKLYDNILENGCIISEFLPGTEPYSSNFPIRNRIISGLSDVVIVVEASEKSGSLITAGLAVEQGKDVVAIPGSIFSDQSKGTNQLIKDGAFPFTNFQDLFQILNLQYKEKESSKTRELKGIQKKIFSIITDNPIHIDDIFQRTNIDIKQLYEVLFELQIKNEILCLAGNYYVKVECKI